MFAALTRTLAVLGLAAAVSGSQQPFSAFGGAHNSYDAGLFSPLEDLGLVSTTQYTTLGHPAFPNYSVRIKQSDFCDGSVRCVWFDCLPDGTE